MRILITGGAGFIGSALVRHLVANTEHDVLNVDKLTYAGVLSSVANVEASERYRFLQADIVDAKAMMTAIGDFQPDLIAHLAAESHVDRSLDGPGEFIQTNIVGTYTLLQAALDYWRGLDGDRRAAFRFHHISTDEVFGSLGDDGCFTETTPYDPRSPYSASKAGADHLVRAWGHSFGLPVLVTNCSNNYGPYHFPEKLIPLIIIRALLGGPYPFMATARMSATGCSSRIMFVRSRRYSRRRRPAKPTMLGATASGPTSPWWRRSAMRSTDVARPQTAAPTPSR